MSDRGMIFIATSGADSLAELETALSSAGYGVWRTDDGSTLLREMVGDSAELVLIDDSVQGMAPLDLVRALHYPEDLQVPVVLLSSNDELDAATGLRAGAVDFIRKPFGLDEALARLEAHLERGRVIRRAKQEAATRGIVLDVIRDVTATLSTEEIFDILVRRVSRLFKIERCSMILVDEHGLRGTIVAAHDNPEVGGLTVDLHRYPEIRQAIRNDTPVLVKDFRRSPLFEEVRPLWESEGIQLDVQSVGAIPFSFEAGRRGVFFLRSGPGEPKLSDESVRLASAIVQGAARALNRAAMFKSVLSHREQLEVLARTDELTGCLTRRYLMDQLEHELERAARYQRLLGLVIFDIDHFKRLNDTLGHTRGDAALRTIGGVLRRSLRSADFVGRYGGDEFLLVLPETGSVGSFELAERIREGIGRRMFDFRGKKLSITVSGGVVAYPETGVVTVEELIDCADQALYRAKWEGRNRVVGYSAQMMEGFPAR